MQECNLENKILELQNQYYQQNPKPTISFTNNQKMNCAKTVSQHIQIDQLFQKTVYNLPETNKVYFDYIIFKTFAHPAIYDKLLDDIIVLLTGCIQTYGSIEIHINLNTFTMTAAQRYKPIIQLFCNKCLQNTNTAISTHVTNMYIYNSPKMINTLSTVFAGFIDDNIQSKINIVN